MDLNHRPPGPEPQQDTEENQSTALNRRRIAGNLSPLIGLICGYESKCLDKYILTVENERSFGRL
jgi:hypothetical protein